MSPRRTTIGLLAVLALLLTAGAASGAGRVLFSGKTAQHQPISFAIASHKLTGLNFWIDVPCAHHQIRRFHALRFSAFTITGSSFDQKFKSAGGSARVKGTIHGSRITGSVSLVALAQHCSGTTKYVVFHPHRRTTKPAS
jgi:hypothetical protein